MTALPQTPHADVQQAQAGDMQVFADIYRRYHGQIWRLIYSRVGRNPDVADDLTADVFVKALKYLPSYTDQGKDISAWLATMAHRIVIDHFKKHRTRLEVPVAEPLDVSDLCDPEAAAVEAVRAVAVRAAVGRLAPAQQSVVDARFGCGLAPAEVAVLIGRPVGGVKMLQVRALQALRRDERLASAVSL